MPAPRERGDSWITRQIEGIRGLTSDADQIPGRPLESFVAEESDARRKGAYAETRLMLKRYELYLNQAAATWVGMETPPPSVRREGNAFKFPLKHRDGTIRKAVLAFSADAKGNVTCSSWKVDDDEVQFNHRGMVTGVSVRVDSPDRLPQEVRDGIRIDLPEGDLISGIRLRAKRARDMGMTVDIKRPSAEGNHVYGHPTRVNERGEMPGVSIPFMDFMRATIDHALGIDIPLVSNKAR